MHTGEMFEEGASGTRKYANHPRRVWGVMGDDGLHLLALRREDSRFRLISDSLTCRPTRSGRVGAVDFAYLARERVSRFSRQRCTLSECCIAATRCRVRWRFRPGAGWLRVERVLACHRSFVLNQEKLAGVPLALVDADPRFRSEKSRFLRARIRSLQGDVFARAATHPLKAPTRSGLPSPFRSPSASETESPGEAA